MSADEPETADEEIRQSAGIPGREVIGDARRRPPPDEHDPDAKERERPDDPDDEGHMTMP